MKLSLNRVGNKEETGALLTFNNKFTKLEDVQINVTESGYGIEHELIEIDILSAILKVHPEIVEFEWLHCRSIFHFYSNDTLKCEHCLI